MMNDNANYQQCQKMDKQVVFENDDVVKEMRNSKLSTFGCKQNL